MANSRVVFPSVHNAFNKELKKDFFLAKTTTAIGLFTFLGSCFPLIFGLLTQNPFWLEELLTGRMGY